MLEQDLIKQIKRLEKEIEERRISNTLFKDKHKSILSGGAKFAKMKRLEKEIEERRISNTLFKDKHKSILSGGAKFAKMKRLGLYGVTETQIKDIREFRNERRKYILEAKKRGRYIENRKNKINHFKQLLKNRNRKFKKF